MPNHLARESSPYLLQHVNNPVDWYPWGPEALARAKELDRPIFLSIGYSACHWCHVMEHESFENPEIARQLNEQFVCIKVDREERPDLDQIYMQVVQMLTGRGGWPMSVFLTPDLEPFFGGTYWPPTSRMGMPGFDRVIEAVAEAWRMRRNEAVRQAGELRQKLQEYNALENAAGGELSLDTLQAAAASLERVFDHQHGGFGGAPKFPHPMDLRVLLRFWRRDGRQGVLNMVYRTLDKMAAGGIYDHLGGGFHRYSVDERWLVPHFEKMLYDNALLTTCYVEAYQVSGNDQYARVIRETLDYLLREMTDPAGGFHSTQDADSEGVEGEFYVWTPRQIVEVLGEERAKTFCYVYDVTETGNFEDRNILNLPKTLEQSAAVLGKPVEQLASELAIDRQRLLEVREKRIAPGLDDKVLVSWNGLAIEAFALAAGALDEPRYLTAAAQAANFLLEKLRRPDGRLLHCWRGGVAKLDAYLDDYACLANALVTLYETDFDEHWIDAALSLAETIVEQFADPARGGFFYTANDHEPLIARPKDAMDSSVPSGNAMAATALLRLGKLCGRGDLARQATNTLAAFSALMNRASSAAGQMLIALDMQLGPTPELVLMHASGDESAATVLGELRRRFIPNRVLASRSKGEEGRHRSAAIEPIFHGKAVDGAGPTLYVCEGFTCQAPVSGADAIRAEWDQLAPPRQRA